MSDKLKIALPKGSLQEPTLELLKKAGYNVHVSSRNYRPTSDDSELDIYLIRAQEVGRYLGQGFIDCGITGLDWAYENGVDLADIGELAYSKVTARPTKWVLVVPKDSPIKTVKDLQGKRIATEAIGMTKRYLAEHGVEADIEFSWGATEVKVPDLVDAIVDVTETGNSIRANNLRIVDTLLSSYPHFYANQESYQDDWKKAKIDKLFLLLNGALRAKDEVGLKMNVPKTSLEAVIAKLPVERPTISALTDEAWVAIEVIISEKIVRDLIPELKNLGAEDIIEYPLNKIVA